MNTEYTWIPKLARREFFRIGATSFAGYHLLPMIAPLQVRAEKKVNPRTSADVCIFLFLMGGAPQLDTFDVKEGKWTPQDFDIRTITPEIRMPVALFPKLSQRMSHLFLTRGMESWESVHSRGQYYLQAGRPFSPARVNEIPSIGSIVAYEFQTRRKDTDFLAPFVGMNFSSGDPGLLGPGMLPSTCAPLPLTVQPDGDIAFVVPEPEKARFNRRWDLLQRIDVAYRTSHAPLGRSVRDYENYYLGAHEMMKRPEVGRILHLSDDDHKRYGATSVGDACILARNLVAADAGTHFIGISHSGWDLHGNEYKKSEKTNHYTLCRELDDCLSALLDDLSNCKDRKGSSLLERTLIVCMGEFGRTPGELNPNKGRDHHRFASTAVFSGAGVKGGRAVGQTDEIGGRVVASGWHKKRSMYPEDVVATIYSALGIDWSKRITNTPSGRTFDYIETTSGTDFLDPNEISELYG
jgi:hypothetical protein